ncbi:MAG: isoleucine--tRNA ligase [Alphaproteobacteria bacterium]|nr:isoleucine--tRNA ligase [Alphaproteobacteria bacterium]HPF45674.1 isoleucine--tRNA ligase [Emcibacteraceae bacterium]
MTKDYRDTIFLPKTDFPMKGNLPNSEPTWLDRWNNIDIYQKIRANSAGRERYILHDGPPYANGDIHMGHAMNKILKDIIVRTQQMLGKDAPYVPGWDCHGLPIEWMIEKKYKNAGKNKDEVDPVEFRKECRAFAEKWVGVQKDEFKRLGIFGDWEDPYLTMDYASEAQIVRELLKFLMNGGLYRGSKSIMWSVVEKTALAEAEIEYMDHTSHMIDIGFTVVKSNIEAILGTKIVIWTTTPWTMPGNRGIAYGKDFEYVLINVTDVDENSRVAVGAKLVLAKELVGAFCARAGVSGYSELRSFKGSELEGTVCHHPWHGQGYDFDVPVIEGFHVTTDAGTGFVHIAPSHGQEDFEVGQQFGLETPYTVDEAGLYYDNVPMFAGEHVYKVHDHVCEEMAKVGALLARDKIVHSYPHSWRSKAPLIFRNTPQWFISMDANDLRKKALKAIDNVRWVPENSKNRINAMVADRPDWLISRQRAWGVPITVFVHKRTNELLKDDHVNERIAAAVEKAGADAWYTVDPQELLGNDYNAADYEQVTDILDVWFDSGSTHAFVLEKREDLSRGEGKRSADLYLEGTDQHRGWFQSSLLESCGTRGDAPYDQVLTHGFTVDKDGRKMSKSLGNGVDPLNIIKQFGADILRLWVTSTDYFNEHRIGDEIIKNQAEAYRKIRNTMRFMIGNLAEFEDKEILSYGEMPELERWVLHRLAKVDAVVRKGFDDYNYHRVYNALYNFCAVDLSAFYFDIRKDALYCDAKMTVRRRAARTVLDEIFKTVTKWFAPILVFTAEEIWQSRFPSKDDSVHLQTFSDIPKSWLDDTLGNKWEKIRTLRKVVTGALEVERREKRIGSSLQASVNIYVDDQSYIDALKGIDLAELCITSDADMILDGAPDEAFRMEDTPGIAVISQLSEGNKCERCWQVLPEVGQINNHEDICQRCADAVEAL